MSGGIEVLREEVNEYFKASETPQPYSAAEYFGMIMNKALDTRQAGNYGIAAAFILRLRGYELIFFGQNGLITENDPHAHAEMDSVQQARKLFNCPDQIEADAMAAALIEQGRLLVRLAPDDETKTIIATTLEPCPMCTVGSVIDTKIDQVIIGAADEYSGAMLDGRLQQLAKIWSDMAENQNLEITLCQNEDPNQTDSYIPKQMQALLNRLFFEHREPMDRILEEEGFFRYNPAIIAAAAQHILDQELSQ
jgi:tRNA(Arg) A34 adenosine deaminase TadA